MSENQLNSSQISHQPQNGQQITENQKNHIVTYQKNLITQTIQQEAKIQNEEGEMSLSQIDYGNFGHSQICKVEKNQNIEGGSEIMLQNAQQQQCNPIQKYQNHQEKAQHQVQNQEKTLPQNQNNEQSNNPSGTNQAIEVKIFDDGYNFNPNYQAENQKIHTLQQNQPNQQNSTIEEEKYAANMEINQQMNQNFAQMNGKYQQFNDSQRPQQAFLQQNHIHQQINGNQQRNYNSYVQGVLNNPLNPSSDPSHEALQEIYNQLKSKFPQCMPEQIILLLYNNLIKIPRQEMIEEEGQKFDHSLKYDGGKRYFQQVSASKNSADMANFQLRKQMVKVYVTKGYGVKIFQQNMLALNPNVPPIDKQKFKAHFVNIYRIVIKKVEEFLTGAADRQFDPITKKEFNMTLSDVINCRKNYSPEFCEVFFKLIQATFVPEFDQLPQQGEVIFFYRTILGKVREQKIIMAKKMHLPEEQKDTDIWSQQFELYFIKLFIIQNNIYGAKFKLIQQYPECQSFITDGKLKQKIQNAIRFATRWIQIQNDNCGNSVIFNPSDIDKRFIMRAPELQKTRNKLLKVYVKKPKDPKVLADVVTLINTQLRQKYEKEQIPPQILQQSTINQIPRNQEKGYLQRIIQAQIVRNP